MFKVLLFTFTFVLLSNNLVNGDCSDGDAKKIEECFAETFFDAPLSMPQTAQLFHEDFLTKHLLDDNKFNQLCDGHSNFTACLEPAIIERCFNTKDFMKVSFAKAEFDARVFVATYLQINYTCGRAYKMVPNLYHCANELKTDCRNKTDKYANCDNANALIKCENSALSQPCGDAAACLYTKFLTLETCNQQNLGSCGICASLTAAKNPIDGLCDADNWNTAPNLLASTFTLFFMMFISFTLFRA